MERICGSDTVLISKWSSGFISGQDGCSHENPCAFTVFVLIVTPKLTAPVLIIQSKSCKIIWSIARSLRKALIHFSCLHAVMDTKTIICHVGWQMGMLTCS